MTGYCVTDKHPRCVIPCFLLAWLLSLAVRLRQCLLCLGAVSGLSATAAHADPYQEMITLAEQDVPGLALHLIDQQQASINQTADHWAAWEKTRIAIYQQRRDWLSVMRRVQALPADLPPEFTRWMLTQGAAAQLESGQGAAAREWLLRLIWQPAVHGCTSAASGHSRHPASGDASASMHVAGCAGAAAVQGEAAVSVSDPLFTQWRRMVIDSYIVEGRADDAYAAMRRYQQDYGKVADAPLQAHVLLLAGRAAEAAVLLADAQEPAARVLYLLARLRSDGRPENILQEADQLLARQRMDAGSFDVAATAGTCAPCAASAIPAPSMDGQVPRAQDAQERPPSMDGQVPRAVTPGILPLVTLVHPCTSQDAQERPAGDTCTSCTAWAVQAEASQLIGDHERRVEALEHMLALCGNAECARATGLFNVNSDSVWEAYVAYAQVLGNQQQLLMGDFKPWFAMAQSLAEDHPVRARALFAFLTLRADTVEMRVRAHQQLLALSGRHVRGAALVRALYASLNRF